MAYDIGDSVRLSATFTVGNTATDPTAPTVKIKDPAGTVTTYVYPTDAQLVKDAVGAYHVDVDCTTSGKWAYRFSGTGAAKAAAEGTFDVTPSLVL